MNLVFVLVSAALYALSFPETAWWWLSFVALVPFLSSLERTRTLAGRLGLGLLWGGAMVAAMGYWLHIPLVSHYGVSIPTAVLFVGAFVIMPVCGLYLLFASAYHLLYTSSGVFHPLVVPSLWVLVEFAKTRLSFLIPWGDIGYAAIPFARFVQVADIGGIYGVTFLIVIINGLLADLPKKLSAARGRGAPVVIRYQPVFVAGGLVVSALVLPILYGQYRMAAMDELVLAAKSSGTDAVVVQGNFSLSDRWSGMGFDNRLKTYRDMSTAPAGGRRVIVWPETMLNSVHLDDRFFLEMIDWIGGESILVAGGLFEDRASGYIFNSAYFVSGTGRLLRYDKRILLPYAEAVPPIDLLGRFYTAPDHFRPGRTPNCIPTPFGGIGTSICLEILYPAFVRNSVKGGGTLLVNLSNDGWFGKSAMPYLHLAAARMRAIENRRFLLRASNTGISALIDPAGRVLQSTGLFTRERISGRFLSLNEPSIYTRFGEWVVFLAAVVVSGSALHRLREVF